MNMTDAQIKATAEGRCCKWCRAPMHRNERGRWVNSGGWEYCTTRLHEAGEYVDIGTCQVCGHYTSDRYCYATARCREVGGADVL